MRAKIKELPGAYGELLLIGLGFGLVSIPLEMYASVE